MPWNLDSDRPIFIQIIEKIQMDIISGLYAPGDKLPSVRELAQNASVNPNTMQKALSELERTGLVYSRRTSGRYITEDAAMITNLKKTLAKDIVTQFLDNMQRLGIQDEEVISLISEIIKGDSHDTVRM
ncbi:MAG: GntR family transcriptional regulator [Lachnospiraceae bacterium]|jgi:DNA-binding transcriptional regulator YhcF (GntR family)|nr:GntR family transcriptional regulator [Lachnospiraceae bacterium]